MPRLKFVLRSLARSPGFSLVAVATLALGIGACTAMFGVVRAVVLKPLPLREPERLVWIENNQGAGLSNRTSRTDTFNAWREQSQSFEALAAYYAFADYGSLTMTGAGEPERLRDAGVSDNFLPTLGVALLHGRNFSAAECAWNGPGAVILGYGFWQRRFAGDPAVVGRTITLNQKPATIIGVLPKTFDFASVFTPGNEVDVLTPFPLTPETARQGNTIFGLGRLKPGVTVAQAQSELTLVTERFAQTLPKGWVTGLSISSLDTALRGRFRAAFLLLAAATACVLAIACVNLSTLLLARLNARRQEFAVRVALGARRRHLVGQVLAESLLFAAAGALLGVPLAVAGTRLLTQLKTFGVPLLQDASVDPAALAVTIGLTAVAGMACGLMPALQLSTTRGSPLSGEASHQRSAGRAATRGRDLLVTLEVALACLLLVGAGLLGRSFAAVLQTNPGFRPQGALAWRLVPQRDFRDGAESEAWFDGLLRQVSRLPGIEAAGLSDTLPLSRNRSWGVAARGVTYPPGQYPSAYPRLIDPHYLRAMGIPLLAGEGFPEQVAPGARPAAIVSESLARRLWPGQDPLGRELSLVGKFPVVVGVVADVRHQSLEETGGDELYLDFRQMPYWNVLELVVRTARPAAAVIPEVRAALRAYDPGLPTGDYYELGRLIDQAVAPRRLVMVLLGGFSALGLVLAALGLYGVIAYSVTQRTREIGIRMAIGAQARDVRWLVLRQGLMAVGTGVGLGLAGSLALTRVLQGQLYGVTAHDPLVLVGITVLLGVVTVAACLIPARRATRVDPVVALRAE